MAKLKEIKTVPYGENLIQVEVWENDEFPNPVVIDPLPLEKFHKVKRAWRDIKDDISMFFWWLFYPILKRYLK